MLRIKIINEKTPFWVTGVTLIIAGLGLRIGCVANEQSLTATIAAKDANVISEEANQIAGEANQTAQKALNITEDAHKRKDLPRLVVYPWKVRFLTLKELGQVKIDMSAVYENVGEVTAKDVTLNFETKDWYNHKTSLFQVHKDQNKPVRPLISMPRSSRVFYPSYAPDVPAGGSGEFIQRDGPFTLKLVLRWKDVNDIEYVYVGVYALRQGGIAPQEYFYFEPVHTFDSVNDGDVTWQFAEEGFFGDGDT